MVLGPSKAIWEMVGGAWVSRIRLRLSTVARGRHSPAPPHSWPGPGRDRAFDLSCSSPATHIPCGQGHPDLGPGSCPGWGSVLPPSGLGTAPRPGRVDRVAASMFWGPPHRGSEGPIGQGQLAREGGCGSEPSPRWRGHAWPGKTRQSRSRPHPPAQGLGEAVGWALQPAPTGRRKVRKAQAIRGLR